MIENENKQIEQVGKYQKCKEGVKGFFFRAYGLMHNHININIGLAHLILILSFMNLFAFIINEENKIYDTSQSADYVVIIQRILSVSHYIKLQTNTMNIYILAVFSVLILEIILMIYLSLFKEETYNKLKDMLSAKVFYYFSVIFYWILLMPTFDVCLTIFSQTGPAVFNHAIAIMNIILLFLLTVLHSIFGHKSFYSSTIVDGFSRVDCHFEIIFLISRIALILMNFFTIKLSLTFWIFLGLNLLVAVVLLRFNLNKLLFYNLSMSKVFLYLLLLYFWILLTSAIIVVTPYKDPWWLIIIGSICFYPVSCGIVSVKLNRLIKTLEYNKHLQTPYLADKYLKELTSLSKFFSRDDQSSLILAGITDHHDVECPNEKCLLKAKELFYIPSKDEFMRKEDYDKKVKHYNLLFILAVYHYYIKNCKQLAITLSYLNFQFEEVGNNIEILFTLYNAETKAVSLQQEFSLYRYLIMMYQKIEEEFCFSGNESKKYSVDMKKVIEYYTLANLLKTMMVESANVNFGFWNSFIFNSENTNVYENGIDIFNKNQKLEQLYNKVRGIYSRDEEITMKYSEYIRYVRGDDRLADKYSNNVDRVEKLDEIRSFEKINAIKEFFFSFETCVVVVQFTKDRNSIEKITESVSSCFGYTPHQVIGKEIETLIPPFYKSRHHNYVNFHFKTGIKRLISREVHLFGFHKQYHVFPIKSLISILPSLDKKLIYMSIMQRLPIDYGFMLVYQNGKIDCMSEKLSRRLRISHEDITENELYIYHIIPNYINDEKSHTKTNFNPKTFLLKSTESTKMKYFTDLRVMIEIKKLTKNFENQSKYLTVSKNINNTNFKTAFNDMINGQDVPFDNWPKFDTEISEINYHHGMNKSENTIMICKVYLDDSDDSSAGSTGTRLVDENMEEDEEDEEYDDTFDRDQAIVIKDLRAVEAKKVSAIKKILGDNKNPPAVKKEKYAIQDGGSSIQLSTTSTGFYQIYSNFRKKLQKYIGENQKSKFAQYIGRSLLFLLISSSVVIFFLSYYNLGDILNGFQYSLNTFAGYDDINCVEKNFNDILLNQFISNYTLSTNASSNLNSCIHEIVYNKNEFNKIIYSEIIDSFRAEFKNITVSPVGFSDDPIRPLVSTTPLYQFILFMLDYIKKIVKAGVSAPHMMTDLVYVKQNYHQMSQQFFNAVETITTNTVRRILQNERNRNVLYVSLRLSVIFLSFIVILPILVVKKSDQLKILENFFQIRNEDAESQRDSCRHYITTTSNLKVEEAIQDEKQENKDKEESQLIDGKKGEQSDLFKDGDKKKGAKKKKKVKKPKTHFSSNVYIINISLIIIFVILVISVVPVIDFYSNSSTFNLTQKFIENKISVDYFAYSMQKAYIETQNILVNVEMNRTYSLDNYQQIFSELTVNQKNFSTFVLSANYMSNYNELYSFLYTDMCTLFQEKNYISATNCAAYQDQNTQEGIYAIFLTVFSKLTEISQEIIRQQSLSDTYVRSALQNANYLYLNEIYNLFIINGFNLILSLLKDSFTNMINSQLNYMIIFFVVFVVILIINQLVVWNKIEKKIHTMEADTYKLFSILPLKFIPEYPSLMAFLKKITQDDD